jgi:hypothetical protein
MLGAGHQGDVVYFLAFNRTQQVAHHAGIHAAVLGLGGLAQPGGDEYVRDIQALQRIFHVLADLKVDGNVRHACRQVVIVARDAGDRPALGRDQTLGQMAANNAGDAGDQRVAFHQFRTFTTAPSLAADLMVASRMVMLLTRSSPVIG